MDKVQALIDILLDKKADLAARDTAALDLEAFPEPRVVDALCKIATNYAEDPIVLDSCGESIASIWITLNHFDEEAYCRFHPIAQQSLRAVIREIKPAWLTLVEQTLHTRTQDTPHFEN